MQTEFDVIFDSTKNSQSSLPEPSQTNQLSEVPNNTITLDKFVLYPNERFNITIVKKSKSSTRLYKISKVAKNQSSTDTHEPLTIKKENEIYISIDHTDKLIDDEVFD